MPANYFFFNMSILIESYIYTFGLTLFTFSWLLADHYSPWESFHSEAMSFLGILFLSIGLITIKKKIAIPKIIFWIIFMGLLPWFQYFYEIVIFSGDAFLASLYISSFLFSILFGFFIATVESKKAIDLIIKLALSFWIAALISAIIGLVQWLQLTEALGIYVVQADKGARALGNLGQPNQLATLLLMGLASLVYLHERNVVGKLTLLLAVSFVTMILVMTQSRAGIVSVLIVGFFLARKQRSISVRVSLNGVLLWVIGFILGTLCLPYLSQTLMLGDSRSLTATETVSERWIMWKQIAYAIAQAPWFGYGWNQTPMAGAIGSFAFSGASPYTFAHNIVLDIMVWFGVPIGLLFTGFIVYWFFSRLRALNSPEAIFAMTCLLSITVHSLLEFPFAYAYFLIAAGLMVGVVEAGHVPRKTVWINVTWLRGFLAVWIALGYCMIYEYFLIEEDFRVVRFENLNLGTTPNNYEVPHIRVLSHMRAMLKASRQPLQPNMSNIDIENLRKVSERFTYGAIRCRYVMALGLNGDPVGAAYQLTTIRSVHGEVYHSACKAEVRRLEKVKYSQLAAVAAS